MGFMRKSRGGIGSALGLGLLLLTGCHHGHSALKPQTHAVAPVPVTTATAHLASVAPQLIVDGTLIARSQIQVLPKTTGRILQLLVHEGDTVHAGQVIAKLDTPELGWQLQQQRSALISAKANDAQAQDNERRMQELAQEGVISQQQLFQARTQAQVAASQVKQAQDAIDLMKSQVANGTITSPIDGVVIAKNLDVGAMAVPSSPIVTIAQGGALQVKLPVAERDLPSVRLGGAVSVTSVAFPGEVFPGKIVEIAPMVDPQTHMITVKADLLHRGGLKIGMDVTTHIPGPAHQGLIVPADAVVTDGAEQIVFLAQGQVAHRVTVTTGLRTSSDIEILSGLHAGDQVVAKGSAFLRDGDAIAVKAAS